MADNQQSAVTSDTKQPYKKGVDRVKEEVLSAVLEEHDLFRSQREKRIELLKRMERHTAAKARPVGYLCFFCSSSAPIDSDDIPAFGDALMSLGDVYQLNLIIDSPGGDGTTAEKMIDLCRCYCKEFRVVVPNRAKSAATIIALGSDQIVMGHCSELGPIDAQVPVIIGGIPRFISAQSFLVGRRQVTVSIRCSSIMHDQTDTLVIDGTTTRRNAHSIATPEFAGEHGDAASHPVIAGRRTDLPADSGQAGHERSHRLAMEAAL